MNSVDESYEASGGVEKNSAQLLVNAFDAVKALTSSIFRGYYELYARDE